MFNKKKNLHHRLMNVSDAEDVARNHAYSRVAGKSKAIPVRRAPSRGTVVPGYRDSMVGSIAQYRDKVPPRPGVMEAQNGASHDKPVLGNRPASGTIEKGKNIGDGKRHFVEPPKRNFNRFG